MPSPNLSNCKYPLASEASKLAAAPGLLLDVMAWVCGAVPLLEVATVQVPGVGRAGISAVCNDDQAGSVPSLRKYVPEPPMLMASSVALPTQPKMSPRVSAVVAASL